MIEVNALKESLDLCEQENAKARRLILWCAERLPKEHVPELIERLKSAVVEDSAEEEREHLLKVLKAIDKLDGVIQAGIADNRNPPPQWWAKLDEHMGQVRGLVNELDLEPTLHEVREGKVHAP